MLWPERIVWTKRFRRRYWTNRIQCRFFVTSMKRQFSQAKVRRTRCCHLNLQLRRLWSHHWSSNAIGMVLPLMITGLSLGRNLLQGYPRQLQWALADSPKLGLRNYVHTRLAQHRDVRLGAGEEIRWGVGDEKCEAEEIKTTPITLGTPSTPCGPMDPFWKW